MRLAGLSLPLACVVLALIVTATFGVIGYIELVRHGPNGLEAAAVAASVCWLSATLALIVGAAFRDSPRAVVGTLVAIPLRMTLPLALGSVLDLRGGPLADAGVFGLIVDFYLVTMFAETTLILCLKERATHLS
jgi:hypothetical protein